MASSIQRASIIAIGSELLGTRRLDTNSLRLTERLERYGIELVTKSVLGDDVEAVAGEVDRLMRSTDLVLVTGGLGPTADDVTRQAVAAALGRSVSIDEAQVDRMREIFAGFGRVMPEVNRRQAEVIDRAQLLINHRGTAPGQQLERDGSHLFLFPGVPRELEAMIDAYLEPWLRRQLAPGGDEDALASTERWVLKVACVPESEVEERIQPAYDAFGRESITVLSSPGEIKVHFFASGRVEDRHETLRPMAEELRRLLGSAVFADHEGHELEAVVGQLLVSAGQTVVTAESCTGGLISERLTRTAGSSAYFLGGVVAYSNPLKSGLLGVDESLFIEHGAVSGPVAEAMAIGARQRIGADYSIAVTGIAGPSGGTDAKPVGTVHLAIAGPSSDGDEVLVREARFPGDRARVRQMTSQLALELLRRRLLANQRAASRPSASPPCENERSERRDR